MNYRAVSARKCGRTGSKQLELLDMEFHVFARPTLLGDIAPDLVFTVMSPTRERPRIAMSMNT